MRVKLKDGKWLAFEGEWEIADSGVLWIALGVASKTRVWKDKDGKATGPVFNDLWLAPGEWLRLEDDH